MKIPTTASSTSGSVFSTMCTSRGRSRKAAPGSRRLDRLAEVESSPAAEDPDDLVVEVVVPRRRARRDVPHEDRGAGRSVVRAVEHLERARAGRLPRLDMVEGDHGLGRPHRRMEVGCGAERHPEDRGTVRLRRRASNGARRRRGPRRGRRGTRCRGRRCRSRGSTSCRGGRRRPGSRRRGRGGSSRARESTPPRAGRGVAGPRRARRRGPRRRVARRGSSAGA